MGSWVTSRFALAPSQHPFTSSTSLPYPTLPHASILEHGVPCPYLIALALSARQIVVPRTSLLEFSSLFYAPFTHSYRLRLSFSMEYHGQLINVTAPTDSDLNNAMVSQHGTSHSDGAKIDALGKFYIGSAIVYTAVVFAGLIALFVHRQHHAVRIRSFKTICTTVLTLHIYLVLVLIAYPLNGLYKCWMEFWVMNILLPLGIALFQGKLVLFSTDAGHSH